jgi:hypothetical protein
VAAAQLVAAARARADNSDSEDSDPEQPGNWLWQLVTEVVPPLSRDDTDVLDDLLPPPHNRHRNPKCHPTRRRNLGRGGSVGSATGTVDGDSEDDALDPLLAGNVPLSGPPVPPAAPALPAGGAAAGVGSPSGASTRSGYGMSGVGGAGTGFGAGAGAGAGVGRAPGPGHGDPVSDVNLKRRKLGLPDLPDPSSRVETQKRVAGRRGALGLNVSLKFYVPREELQQVLSEYEGPYGQIAEYDEDVRNVCGRGVVTWTPHTPKKCGSAIGAQTQLPMCVYV